MNQRYTFTAVVYPTKAIDTRKHEAAAQIVATGSTEQRARRRAIERLNLSEVMVRSLTVVDVRPVNTKGET